MTKDSPHHLVVLIEKISKFERGFVVLGLLLCVELNA